MTYKPSPTAPGYVAPPASAISADPYAGSKVLLRGAVPTGSPLTYTTTANTIIDNVVIISRYPIPVQIQLDGVNIYNGTAFGTINLNTNIKTITNKVLTAGATYPGVTVHVSGVETA